MFILTAYENDENIGYIVGDEKPFCDFDTAYNYLLAHLNNCLNENDINYFDIVKTNGIEYHHRNETPTETSGLFICAIVNYDYNSNVYINITHVMDNSDTLKNG